MIASKRRDWDMEMTMRQKNAVIIPFGHFLGAHLDVAFPEIANDL